MDEQLLIVGTGAMACLFAARLSAAGAGVTMLGTWAEGLAALRTGGVRVAGVRVAGVRVAGVDGEEAYPVQVVDDPAHCAGASLALVLVKLLLAGRHTLCSIKTAVLQWIHVLVPPLWVHSTASGREWPARSPKHARDRPDQNPRNQPSGPAVLVLMPPFQLL